MIKIKGLKQTLLNIKQQSVELVEAGKLNKMNTIVVALKEATPVDTGEARDGWKIEGSSIVNPVEHIKYLNEGSSVQAPLRFIEQTVLSQEGINPSGIIVVNK
jgi:hypothetical protein